jgi:hypothetical protein
MSRVLFVYVGPCLRIWKRHEETEAEFTAAVDAYMEPSHNAFLRVFTGNSEDQIFLIPNRAENRPDRYCEWSKNDMMEPVTLDNISTGSERSKLYEYIGSIGWPTFAYDLTWGVVPYRY